jgi:hypothetical protein
MRSMRRSRYESESVMPYCRLFPQGYAARPRRTSLSEPTTNHLGHDWCHCSSLHYGDRIPVSQLGHVRRASLNIPRPNEGRAGECSVARCEPNSEGGHQGPKLRTYRPSRTFDNGHYGESGIRGANWSSRLMLDRLPHHAEVISINGRSYRMRHHAQTDQPISPKRGSK